MPAFSRTEGPVDQRDFEDIAALLAGCVANDRPERHDLTELGRVLAAVPFTRVSLDKARRLCGDLITLNVVEDPSHDEALAIAQRAAGRKERMNREDYENGKEKALNPLAAGSEPAERSHNQSTTSIGQLPLFGEPL